MRKITMLSAAIAVAFMTSGIALMPVQAEADPECTHDYTMGTSRPLFAEDLAVSEVDVVRIEVDQSGARTVTVELSSNDDELQFTIHFLNGTACDVASGTAAVNCQDPEGLDTTPVLVLPPLTKDCTVQPPSSGEREYFFNIVNVGANSLDYRVWDST